MASRERKRAERRRRQERTTRKAVARSAELAGAPTEEAESSGQGGSPIEPGYSRSAERDREARESLEPLPEGERPTVVTVAAAVTALFAIATIAGFALWDVLRDEDRPRFAQVALFGGMLVMMTYGLWRARYWAVLGFQALLVIVILLTAGGLFGAFSLGIALGNLTILAGACTLFYFMIKAMARIQMPGRG